MGYRSLKRVLGESNLERKCRWLFGLCVGGLILLAFLSVGWIAENLIDDAARNKGRGVARLALFNSHWQSFDNSPGAKMLQEEVVRELDQESLDYQFLSTDPIRGPTKDLVSAPTSELEKEILQRLRVEAQRRLAASPGRSEGGEAADLAAALEFDATSPVHEAVPDPANGKYHYYQVVQWSDVCITCHAGMYGLYSQSAASTAGMGSDASSMPLRVIRVTVPYEGTRAAINRTRAVLWTVGILTVFLAMVALYYVVKYIVIKPLLHLREVSDAVARGDLAQRADIHTNDEFEELANSYNKMLRNLVDAHSELRSANIELDAKVDELARLNMQLHEMNRLKGEYLATMSHELRTPLNSILGFSELLQGIETLSDKQKRYVQNIQLSGHKLLELINDILDLEKMEAGKMEVRLSEFRIDALLHTQVELVRSLAEDKNIDLQVEIEGDIPLLYQDQAKVQQILTNLLSNAIKFTPEGGRITVGTRSDSRGRIEIWVTDTGVGIPDDEQEMIFEKFRQGTAALGRDNLTREYSGTGLGLSIVRELCKLLGGEVTVESELGKGSTFRVVLPWMRTEQPLAASRLSQKLDELSRPRRLEATSGDSQPAEVAAAADGA